MLRAQQILDKVFEARPRKKAVPKAAPAPAPAQPLMNPEELETFALGALGFADFINMLDFIERGADFGGSVHRHNHHYVHSKSVSFEARGDWSYDESNPGNPPSPDDLAKFDAIYVSLEKKIDSEVEDIGDKIYRALERGWDYQNSDEAVEENIRANDYDFNEEGERENEGGFKYDALPTDEAKEKARDWFREGHCDDNFWSEHIVDEWKEELEGMGFGDPDISYSGFWSQGDGASFVCKSFDFRKYAHFFMSGENMKIGHPYTDELAEQQRKAGLIESDLGIDMEKFTRDSIYSDFRALATPDPQHERHHGPWEKRYQTSKMSPDSKFFIRLSVYDAALSDKPGSVRVELYAQAWDMSPDGQKNSGNVNRKVRFFVPVGEKSKLISVLLDYWLNAKGVADRRDSLGELKDPQKMCRSLARRLSLLAGQWKQEQAKPYNDHLDAQAKAFMDAMTPEQKAALEKKRSEWIAKHPEPSEEKLELRAEMKKWKAERDAAARAAVPPPPAQESADDDLLGQMGDVAMRGAVNNIGNIMMEQPVRYMSGAKQYHWRKQTPDWTHKITATATVYSAELPDQPWEFTVAVIRGAGSAFAATAHWRIDYSASDYNDKNYFGLSVAKLIPALEQIAYEAGPTPEPIMAKIESAFNTAFGLEGGRAEHFYEY